MKILITTDWYEPVVNGVVASVLNLRSELLRRGHQVKILTLSPNHRSYCSGDITYIGSLGVGRIYPSARIRLKRARRLLKDILLWKPDIVHSQCEFSTFHMGRKISEKLGVPLIHTYHTVYEQYTHYFCPSRRLGRQIAKGLSRHTLNETDRVIVPSKKVGSLLEDYQVRTPVHVIPTGIDVPKFAREPHKQWMAEKKRLLNIPQDHLLLVYIGRLAKEKNLEEILGYLSRLPQKNVTLLVVGDGPHRQALEEQADALDLRDRVIFAGMVPPEDVAGYYHLGDVFVNASTSETQGLTYFEALSAGLPLLCRKDACLDGVVENGINGWQYQTEQEFQKYLSSFCLEARREDMSRRAYEVACSQYSIPAFVDEVERLYHQALNYQSAS